MVVAVGVSGSVATRERRGTATLAVPLDGQREYCRPRTRRGPVTAFRDMPDRGPNNEQAATGLDSDE